MPRSRARAADQVCRAASSTDIRPPCVRELTWSRLSPNVHSPRIPAIAQPCRIKWSQASEPAIAPDNLFRPSGDSHMIAEIAGLCADARHDEVARLLPVSQQKTVLWLPIRFAVRHAGGREDNDCRARHGITLAAAEKPSATSSRARTGWRSPSRRAAAAQSRPSSGAAVPRLMNLAVDCHSLRSSTRKRFHPRPASDPGFPAFEAGRVGDDDELPSGVDGHGQLRLAVAAAEDSSSPPSSPGSGSRR